MVTKTLTNCDICKSQVGKFSKNNDFLILRDKNGYIDLCFECRLKIEKMITKLKKEYEVEEKEKEKMLKKLQAKND